MIKKGIILAGGMGTRMSPLTKAINKQLLPIYDKPLIFYSLSILMLAKIKNILIIVNKGQLFQYKNLLGDGKNLGLSITYAVQPKPQGLAQSFLIGEEFIGDSSVCLVLGDNIFYGNGLEELLKKASISNKPTIFSYHVSNPKSFGVVEFDDNNNIIGIEEKPDFPKSNHAVTGLYFYNNDVIDIAKKITPSKRGELEITDINISYMKKGNLLVEPLSAGHTWLDTGTPESLMKASQFIYTVEERQGIKISCPEEIAYNNKWVLRETIEKNIKGLSGNYVDYIKNMISS